MAGHLRLLPLPPNACPAHAPCPRRSASATLHLLPTLDYSCTVWVAGSGRTFVPGDSVALAGTAQLTPVGSASQPWASSNVTVVVGGAGGWQALTLPLDAQGSFTASYAVPPWASAVGTYPLLCRHPAYTGEQRSSCALLAPAAVALCCSRASTALRLPPPHASRRRLDALARLI